MSDVNDRPPRSHVSRVSLRIGIVAALLISANGHAMAEPPVAEPQLDRAQVAVSATVSPSGGTLRITPKSPDQEATVAALASYGKFLTERLQGGDLEPLFVALPARPEVAKRLKDNPVAFAVATQRGAIEVQLIASGQESRKAVHAYLAPVLTQHVERAANHPGSNLGWDAPPDSEVKK